MKIEIKAENNCFVVSDEFNFVHEEFKTSEEALEFLNKKITGAKLFRAVFYVSKNE